MVYDMHEDWRTHWICEKTDSVQRRPKHGNNDNNRHIQSLPQICPAESGRRRSGLSNPTEATSRARHAQRPHNSTRNVSGGSPRPHLDHDRKDRMRTTATLAERRRRPKEQSKVHERQGSQSAQRPIHSTYRLRRICESHSPAETTTSSPPLPQQHAQQTTLNIAHGNAKIQRQIRVTQSAQRSVMPHGRPRLPDETPTAILWTQTKGNPPPLPELGMAPWRRAKKSNKICELPQQEKIITLQTLFETRKKQRQPWHAIATTTKWDTQFLQEPWPIHAPHPPCPAHNLINDIIRDPHVHMAHKQSLHYLHDDNLYKNCPNTTTFPKTDLSQCDVHNLTEKGYLEHCPKPASVGYIFRKPEPEKQRFRIIHDTLGPNTALPDPPNPKFRGIWELRRLVHKGSWAVAADFKCYYYHFELHPDIRKFFAININNNTYQFTRLPMGFKWAVIITQTITNFLTRKIDTATATDTYIDNVLFICTTEKDAKQTATALQQRCARYGIIIGELEIGQQVQHRGIIMDLLKKTVRVRPSTLDKLTKRAQTNTGTWGEWRSLLATQLHTTLATGTPLGQMFACLKWAGRNTLTNPNKKSHAMARRLQRAPKTPRNERHHVPCASPPKPRQHHLHRRNNNDNSTYRSTKWKNTQHNQKRRRHETPHKHT
eukprot:PhM_4_TR14170/c6_g3_i3/m.47361